MSPNRHQRVPTVTMYLGDKSGDKSGGYRPDREEPPSSKPSALLHPP